MMVSGTKMISETSLVTNMDEKKTENTRKSESAAMERMPPASRSSGRKIFSLLKPSSTVSIMKRVARVCQSMSESSRAEGGVINSDATAAAAERSSIGSLRTSAAALAGRRCLSASSFVS